MHHSNFHASAIRVVRRSSEKKRIFNVEGYLGEEYLLLKSQKLNIQEVYKNFDPGDCTQRERDTYLTTKCKEFEQLKIWTGCLFRFEFFSSCLSLSQRFKRILVQSLINFRAFWSSKICQKLKQVLGSWSNKLTALPIKPTSLFSQESWRFSSLMRLTISSYQVIQNVCNSIQCMCSQNAFYFKVNIKWTKRNLWFVNSTVNAKTKDFV